MTLSVTISRSVGAGDRSGKGRRAAGCWKVPFVHVVEVALQFVLAREAVVATILAADNWAGILWSIGAMLEGVMAPEVRKLFDDSIAIMLGAFILCPETKVTYFMIRTKTVEVQDVFSMSKCLPANWHTVTDFCRFVGHIITT